jgi:uncharacterized membrane protein YjjP (DUF1212 family)
VGYNPAFLKLGGTLVRPAKRSCIPYVWFAIGSFIIVAAIVFTAGEVPAKPLPSLLRSFSAGPQSETFKGFFTHSIRGRLQWTALISLFLAFLPFDYRRKMSALVASLESNLSQFFRGAVRALIEGVRKESRFHLCMVALLGVMAIGLRLSYLNQPMCGDESWTFDKYASMPLYIGLTRYSSPNNHLFHTLLVHTSFLIFGNHPWAIRLPAFVAGILVVPATYLITRKASDKYAALFAAGLAASSSALIMYSTNARGHIIVVLIFELNLMVGLAMLRNRNPVVWILFSCLNAIGFYTVPAMLYPFGATILCLLVMKWRQDRRPYDFLKDLAKSIALTAALTLVLYAPVIMVSGLSAITSNQWVQRMDWHSFLAYLPGSARTTVKMWVIGLPVPLWIGLLAAGLSSLFLRKYAGNWLLLLLAAAAVWVIFLVFAQRVFVYARLFLFLLPIALGLCAAGVTGLLGRPLLNRFRRGALLVSVLFICLSLWAAVSGVRSGAVYTLDEADSLRDAEAITLFFKDYLHTGDRVVAESPSDNPLDYYFGLHDVPTQYLTADPTACTRIIVVVNDTTRQSTADVLSAGRRRIEVEGQPSLILKVASASVYEYTNMPKPVTGSS